MRQTAYWDRRNERIFKTNKQLNAFVGIDIKRYQSGTSKSRDTINKRGNKKARRLLYLIIIKAILWIIIIN